MSNSFNEPLLNCSVDLGENLEGRKGVEGERERGKEGMREVRGTGLMPGDNSLW